MKNKTNKTNIMATALRAAAMITASAGLASAQGVVAGGAGVNMESTGSIINGSINTFPNGTTITWASTPGLQGFFVPAGQLTGLTPTGEEVSYEDLIPLKSTSISVMSGAPGAAPTGTGTLIDDTGISTNGLSLLDTSTGSLVDIAVTDGTLTVGGAPVTGGGGTTDGVLGTPEFGVVDAQQLGYVPSDTATAATAPAILNKDGISYTKHATWTYSGHSYAVYSSGNSLLPPISWRSAFDEAKNLGGYLATMTSFDEWQAAVDAFEDARLNAGAPDLSKWLGLANYTDNDTRIINQAAWVTGEESAYDRSLVSGVTQSSQVIERFHNMNGIEPNGGVFSGFFEISVSSLLGRPSSSGLNPSGTLYGWNDNSNAGGPLNQSFVVEFQQ